MDEKEIVVGGNITFVNRSFVILLKRLKNIFKFLSKLYQTCIYFQFHLKHAISLQHLVQANSYGSNLYALGYKKIDSGKIKDNRLYLDKSQEFQIKLIKVNIVKQ